MIAQADPRQVWIVDDDETTLMLGEEILLEQGFAVRTFSDSAAALAAAAEGRPDIIVLDVMMPGMDGFEFCARLRADPATADVPVLMVTSLHDASSIERGYDVGATNFATKPIHWVAEGHRLRYMLRAAETAGRLRTAERAARTAKEDWERTFDAISDVVTLLDADLRIVRANAAAARVAKREMGELVGARCFEVFADDDAPCAGCPVQEALATGHPAAGELRYAAAGAACMVIGTPLPTVAGRAARAVHIARDLTEQKALEARYLHAQKMEAVGTLANGIAHDFNNILAVIHSSAELLRHDLAAGSESRELADAVVESARRGAALARRLLTFSRKGAVTGEQVNLCLDDVVGDLTGLVARLIPSSITLRTQLDAGSVWIRGSADQLGQVVMNLVTNAAHAMPSGGELRLETRAVDLGEEDCRLVPGTQPGRHACLVVSDTGQGMDAETMRRMYEPFFTTKGVGQGSGLGLSVVFGIVNDHGGGIWCQSALGAGTTFSVFLPAVVPAAPGPAPDAEAAPAVRGGDETLLLVEDDGALRGVLGTALRRAGYEVILAGDGEAALEQLAQARSVDLVILDLGMPGVDGWECLRRLRAEDPSIRVLLDTGYGAADLAGRAAREGAAALLRKPFGVADLLRKVREVLDAPRPGLTVAGTSGS